MALAVGTALLCALFAVPFFLLGQQELAENTRELLAAETHAARQVMESRIAKLLDQAGTLAARLPAGMPLSVPGKSEAFSRYIGEAPPGETLGALAVADSHGGLIAIRGALPRDVGADPIFWQAMQSDRPMARIRHAGGKPALLVFNPIRGRGDTTAGGMVVAYLPLVSLLSAESNEAQLLDATGRLLAGLPAQDDALTFRTTLSLPAPAGDLGLALQHARSREATFGHFNFVALTSALACLAVAAAMLFGARLWTRRLLAPLHHLAAAADSIASTGRPTAYLELKGDEEFVRLARAINAMLTRLQQSYADLENRVAERTRALGESESRLRYVMAATGDGVWDWDIASNRVTHNSQWCRILGLGDEYLTHTLDEFSTLIHPEDLNGTLAAIQRCLDGGIPYRHEYRMRRPNGETIWVLDRGDVVEHDAAGKALRMVGGLSDITERKVAAETLRVRELYLRATLDNLPFLFWLKDAESRFLAVNKVFSDACGRASPDELCGLSDFDVWPADLAAAYRADDRQVMRDRTEKAVEEAVQQDHGRGWIETYKKPVIGDDGTLLGTVGFARDITARKAIEQALADSEERWELAVTGANDGIWDWDPASDSVFYSERWKTMLGYSGDEIGPTLDEWQQRIHPDDHDWVMAEVERHLRGETAFYQTEHRLRCKDGSYKWVLDRGRARFDEHGKALRMSGSHTDTTERRAAEARLQERTDQLNAIFDLSPDGILSFDRDFRVQYASPAFMRMFGIEEQQVLGQHEDVLSRLIGERCAAATPFRGLAPLRLERGNPARRGRPSIELTYPCKRILEIGLRVSQADSVSQILYFRDITHESEVDRMKSEFLSTAAHELRTPMASIYGFSELLLNQSYDEATRHELLETIFRQSELMTAIINELLDLARIEARRGKDFVFETLDLDRFLQETLAGYKTPEGRAAPRLHTPGEAIAVHADRKKLQQAMLNVLSNAYKYSPAGGDVDIRIEHHREGDCPAEVGIVISDRGLGMTPAQLARVCERFYRADTSGKIPGTGLGMSIVKEIMELHLGRIALKSHPGQGTTVGLWLPAAHAGP